MNGALRSLQQNESQPTDESGSDSEGDESTSSSYSSLSDFVSEMASSDLSPSMNAVYGSHSHQHYCPQTISSNLDTKLFYRPPSSLRFPEGMEPRPKSPESRPDSPDSTASSKSDLSSPSFNRDSEFDFPQGATEMMTNTAASQKKPDVEVRDKEKAETLHVTAVQTGGSFENESDSNSTTTTKTILSGQAISNEVVTAPEGEKRRMQKVRVSRADHFSINNFNSLIIEKKKLNFC